MSRETIYFVQSFTDKLGALKADAAVRCKGEEAALRAARRLSETKAGAVAFSSSGDAELGDYDEEPIILSVLGRVPDQFLR
jgi:hypothetical protein